MIIQDSFSHNYQCPIMSRPVEINGIMHPYFGSTCIGSKCMAWRPYENGLGFCGLCNPARDHGTPDEQAVKHSASRGAVVDLSEDQF